MGSPPSAWCGGRVVRTARASACGISRSPPQWALSAWPIFWTLPTAAVSGAAAAAAIALINTVGNVGSFTGPYVIGWIKSATGSYSLGLLAVGSGLLLTGVTAVMIGDPAAESRGDPPLRAEVR
jgi:hypothetical protein